MLASRHASTRLPTPETRPPAGAAGGAVAQPALCQLCLHVHSKNRGLPCSGASSGTLTAVTSEAMQVQKRYHREICSRALHQIFKLADEPEEKAACAGVHLVPNMNGGGAASPSGLEQGISRSLALSPLSFLPLVDGDTGSYAGSAFFFCHSYFIERLFHCCTEVCLQLGSSASSFHSSLLSPRRKNATPGLNTPQVSSRALPQRVSAHKRLLHIPKASGLPPSCQSSWNGEKC